VDGSLPRQPSWTLEGYQKLTPSPRMLGRRIRAQQAFTGRCAVLPVMVDRPAMGEDRWEPPAYSMATTTHQMTLFSLAQRRGGWSC
jgi:hypothetical protein